MLVNANLPTVVLSPVIPLLGEIPDKLLSVLDSIRSETMTSIDCAVRKLLDSRNPGDFFAAERTAHDLCRSVADDVVGAVLQFLAADPRFVQPCREFWTQTAAAQGGKLQSNGYKSTSVQLLGGAKVKVSTLRLALVAPRRPGRKPGRGKRGKAGPGVYPALAQLGIVGKATPALMAEVGREVAESQSVAVARASLAERGLNLHHNVALRLAYTMASRSLDARSRRFEGRDSMLPAREDADLFVGKRLLISTDGGRLKVRENPKAGRRRKETGHRRYDGVWREPKVITIVVLNERGRRDPKFPPLIDATMGDANDVADLLVGHLKAHGGEKAAEVTLVADGAEWIWNRAAAIRDRVGIPKDRWYEVLDFWHAVEHLSDASKLVRSWTAEERASWLRLQKRRLRHGRAHLVMAALEKLRVGRRAKGIGKEINYFKTHREHLDYAACREHHRPMGSGAIESGVRRVVNLRMKGNSIFWLEEHAEGLLHLRSVLKSSRWNRCILDAISTPAWALAS